MAAYRPAVVIVDLGLPDGNGAELIAAIASTTMPTPAQTLVIPLPRPGCSPMPAHFLGRDMKLKIRSVITRKIYASKPNGSI